MIDTPSTCPKCGDQLSTPIRSGRWPNVYVQTCRNNECLHTERTTVEVAPEPERPRPVSLPIEPPAPRTTRSAIDAFERAYESGETRQLIRRSRRQVAAAIAADGQRKRLGRDA
jgi:hypothetical protein